jgi:hypothetical protein
MKATMGRADSNGNGGSIPCGIRKPEENLARQRERLAGIELGSYPPRKNELPRFLIELRSRAVEDLRLAECTFCSSQIERDVETNIPAEISTVYTSLKWSLSSSILGTSTR